jgi:hypothetical protein
MDKGKAKISAVDLGDMSRSEDEDGWTDTGHNSSEDEEGGHSSADSRDQQGPRAHKRSHRGHPRRRKYWSASSDAYDAEEVGYYSG